MTTQNETSFSDQQERVELKFLQDMLNHILEFRYRLYIS